MAGSSIDGLVSGLDTSALIDSLMAIEKQPRDLLATQQANQQKAITAAKSIESKLSALSLAAATLQRSSGWMLRTGTSSNDSVATVSADAGAGIASFSFSVDVLASAHGVVTNTSVAGTDTVVASGGTVTLTVGGESHDVSVGGGTLAEVATALNGAGLGVRAAVVNTGAGYRLQLTSATTGAASTFTVDAGLDGNVGGTSVTAQGVDARITVGTGPGAYSITSASNRFGSIVRGVAVTVKQLSVTPVTVGVAADAAGLAKNIKAMVDAANEALAEIATQTKYDATTKTASPLTGDTAVRRLSQNLTKAVTSAITQSSLVSPGLAGVAVDKAGKVTFDQAKFLDSYAKDPAAVERLFVQGATSTGSVTFNFAGNTVPAGTYDVVITSGATTATTTGLGGGWVPGSEPTIKVRQSGREVSYAVQPTDDIDAARAGLQAAIDADSLAVDVVVDAGALKLTARTPGVASSFEASWDGGTVWNPAAGVDAIGTIGGEIAYGNGTTFGIPASAAKWGGLSVVVAGSGTGAVGSFAYEPGLAQRLITSVRDATDDGTGYLASSESSRQARIDQLTASITAYDIRLAKRQETLKKQYAALEVALGKLKNQSSWLAGQLNSLNNLERVVVERRLIPPDVTGTDSTHMPIAPPPRSTRIDGARARYQQHGKVASPGRSVVLLYERLLRDLDDATIAIGARDHAAAHDALIHAQKIVDGLDVSLDRSEWTGASALGAVYEYLGTELVAANITKDQRRIAACRQVVEPLAEAWRGAWAEMAGAGAA